MPQHKHPPEESHAHSGTRGSSLRAESRSRHTNPQIGELQGAEPPEGNDPKGKLEKTCRDAARILSYTIFTPYYTILYCTVLYYTILYYIILHYTILYHIMCGVMCVSGYVYMYVQPSYFLQMRPKLAGTPIKGPAGKTVLKYIYIYIYRPRKCLINCAPNPNRF